MTALQTQTKSTGAKKLEGKVALVTGGSRGIGAAIALRLAAEGARVIVNYNSNKSAAEDTVAILKGSGAEAIAVQGNIAKETEGKKVVDEAVRHFGKIDILVNNAAVWGGGTIDKVDLKQYDDIFNVNVRGVIAATTAALPYLNDGGRIINISSGAARISMAGYSIYSASKAALDTLTRVWAQELGARKITVNGVAPGTTLTDMFLEAMPAEVHQPIIDKTALGRIADPKDIADVVAFLASDDARWITGTTIAADGGLNM